jgi:hypothetical protein
LHACLQIKRTVRKVVIRRRRKLQAAAVDVDGDRKLVPRLGRYRLPYPELEAIPSVYQQMKASRPDRRTLPQDRI